MRKISATYIFPGNQPPLKNGILVCSDDGLILGLEDTGGQLREQAGLEQYSGILVPAFITVNYLPQTRHSKKGYPRPMENSTRFWVLGLSEEEHPSTPYTPEFPLPENQFTICLGTPLSDRLQNSVLSHMRFLQNHISGISLEKLIRWATFNGARALHKNKMQGSLEPGKTPGIYLITGVNLINLKLTPRSRIKPLVTHSS